MRESEYFIQANQTVSAYVAQVGDKWDQMVPSTPDWTVAQLVAHISDNNRTVITALEGDVDVQVDAADVAAAWTTLADRAENDAEAATDEQATVDVGGNETPVGQFFLMQTVDRVLHAWDLANAIGADSAIEPRLVQVAYDFIQPRAEGARAAGLFGAEVEVGLDASVQDKLLALTGRTPA